MQCPEALACLHDRHPGRAGRAGGGCRRHPGGELLRREQGPASTAAAVSELALLQQTGDELARQDLLRRLGSSFVPPCPGVTDVMLGALAIWLTQPGLDR